MKTLIIAILVALFASKLQAQSDSLLYRIEANERAINDISASLKFHSKQFETGFNMSVLGTAIVGMALGAQAISDNPGDDIYPAVMIGGSAIAFAGWWVMCLSHRELGKAGNIRVGPGVISYRF